MPLRDATAQLEARVPVLLEEHDVPGAAVALVRDGDVAWAKGTG
jgi:CubicO group peptidase (beta-lactamase class C family)